MSDLMVFEFDPVGAADYNQVAAESVGWLGNIPREALQKEPLLTEPYDSEEFAQGVFNLQKTLFKDEEDWDGKLGRGTWGKVLKAFDCIEDSTRYVVHHGRRLMLSHENPPYRMINFDQPEGYNCHQYGDFYKGRGKYQINYIVLHWGSTSAYRLAKVLAGREISSHFGIDRGEIYQYLDTYHRAWHAGNVNNWSVGIDFCQQPTEGWAKRLQKKGWDVELVDNPTDRGHKKITTLNPEAVAAGRAFIEDLCVVLGVPFRLPRGKDGLEEKGDIFHGVIPRPALKDGTFRGVVGHHHVTGKKWDIAPWWEQLFGDLY